MIRSSYALIFNDPCDFPSLVSVQPTVYHTHRANRVMSQVADSSVIPIDVNKVKWRILYPLQSVHFCSTDLALGGHRSLIRSRDNRIHHSKLYRYPHQQESPCRRLHPALCGRVPLRHHWFSIHYAHSSVCSSPAGPPRFRRRFRFQGAGRDPNHFQRGGRRNKRLVARDFLSQDGLSILLPQVDFSSTELEHVVVVCYHTYYNCWSGQHSRFLDDLPILYY